MNSAVLLICMIKSNLGRDKAVVKFKIRSNYGFIVPEILLGTNQFLSDLAVVADIGKFIEEQKNAQQ
jgi:hypothetical protein